MGATVALRITSGVVAGFGVGLLIALTTLTFEAGPDINLVGQPGPPTP